MTTASNRFVMNLRDPRAGTRRERRRDFAQVACVIALSGFAGSEGRAQLQTQTENRVVLTQIWPPAPTPLLHLESRLPRDPNRPPTRIFHSGVPLAPGRYQLEMWSHAQAFLEEPPSSGCFAEIRLFLNLGSASAAILPSSSGMMAGFLTELGGHQTAWFPPAGRNFSVLVPAREHYIGYQSTTQLHGWCLTHGLFEASLQQGLLSAGTKALGLATYSTLTRPGGWQWTTSSVQIRIDFEVHEATTVTIAGGMNCEFEGDTQAFPILPTIGDRFLAAPSGRWFDPPLALGYELQQTGNSLFTDLLSLPVGIDGDGFFEIVVGTRNLGRFAAGSRVDFRALLGGNGVPSFRILGVDPALDAGSLALFPVQLAFDTPFADFRMTPLRWRSVGASCFESTCAVCPGSSLEPVGDALLGNAGFGLTLSDGPVGGAAIWFFGAGSPASSPLPFACGLLHLPPPLFELGATSFSGAGNCTAATNLPLPLPADPLLFGAFATAQAAILCPGGSLGLSNAVEFPIGS